MKQNLVVRTILLICILLTLPALSAAEIDRRDGNWWRKQDVLTRSVYVIGFFDGMDLGNKFSYWKFTKDKKLKSCMEKVAESYTDYNSKYFNNITNGQVMDGLNSFYEDYRNRSIRVADAIWLVVNGIAGTPQETLDKMIENWRRNVR